MTITLHAMYFSLQQCVKHLSSATCPIVAAMAVSQSASAVDTHRSGMWRVASVTVQPGDRIIADATLRIISTGPVVIDGQIEAAAGASIEIAAPVIRIRGGISTADGSHSRAVGGRGQHAGSITLGAGAIELIGGSIEAGNGGNGGRSGDGGNGGSVTIVGCPVLSVDEGSTMEAGSGGDGGEGIDGYMPADMDGGDGGDTGQILIDPCCMTALQSPAPPSDKQTPEPIDPDAASVPQTASAGTRITAQLVTSSAALRSALGRARCGK